MSAATTDPTGNAGREATGTGNRRSKTARRRFSPRERRWAIGMIVLLAPLAIAWIYPFVWTVSASLRHTDDIFGSVSPFSSVITFSNYSEAWYGANMGRYFFNTVFVTGFSILIAVTSAALMGYVLGRYSFPGKKVLIGAFALLIFLPEGYTIIPIYDLIDRIGLIGSLWGVTLAQAGGVSIISVLLFAGFFAQLPKELEEAARVDGAGFFRIFARVYLPLAKPVTATAVILQFMHSWNDFLLPLVLTLTRPELRTLAVGIYDLRNQYFSEWGVVTAASTIGLLPMIILFLFLQKYFVDSIAGAVKG